MAPDLDELREIYLADLRKQVPRNFKLRSRVRYPEAWAKLESPERIMLLERENIENVWVWSDLHFGHKNIIDFSDRPFPDTHQMNEHLIANFNEYVKPTDISIWVGDVAFMNDEKANEILARCNGYKILVAGNHDFHKKKLKNLNFDEIYLFYLFETPDVDLVFTHYPIEKGLPWPCVNVHGHIHVGKYQLDSPQHINVCCEFHNYRPIELKQLIEWARMRVISHGI